MVNWKRSVVEPDPNWIRVLRKLNEKSLIYFFFLQESDEIQPKQCVFDQIRICKTVKKKVTVPTEIIVGFLSSYMTVNNNESKKLLTSSLEARALRLGPTPPEVLMMGRPRELLLLLL